jgi:two-component system, chemotaxis family, CheB/CheR fusion protein
VIYQRRFLTLHRSYASQLLASQDEERAWVAREVHDDALQRLALLDHECDVLRISATALTTDQKESIQAIRAEIKDLGVMLRDLAHRLHPALIDRGGLGAALNDLAEEMDRAFGLRVELDVPPRVPPVNAGQALAVYRIAQEALRNVARHAGVDRASLTLKESGTEYELIISDAGRGIATDGGGPGLGLVGMRERALLAGGVCQVASTAGGGTTVRARFPLVSE